MTRPGYKMTEIGEIPKKWELEELRNICVIIRNGLTNRQDTNGVPISRIETISNGNFSDKFGRIKSINGALFSKYRIRVGDILISHINSAEHIGKAAIYKGVPKIILHGMNLLLLRFDTNKADPFFYIQYLKYSKTRDRIRSLAKKAVNQASINQSELSKLLFPIPPLPEQQKIAEILSTADETVQKVNEEIYLTEKLKKGLMQTLLIKGIGHAKFKMTEIGEIPEEWRNEKISKLGQIVTGGTPSTSEPAYWNGEIPWIASGDVHQRYIKMARKFITQEGYLKSNCNLLPIGTVLIALNGQGKTRGLSAILDIEAVCNQSMAGIIPKRDILNSVYLLYHLLNRYAEIRNISGIGRNGLNLEHIGNIVISCPPLIEQEKIAEIISTIDNKLLLLEHKKERLERLKKGLMGDLLTGKVRVKINTSKGED